MKSLFKVIGSRRSVREFKPDPIPEKVLHTILEAARWAPSGGNGQNHVFGIVTDPAKRKALAEAAGGQMWIADAPVVLACCARLYKPEEESDFSREVNKLRWGKEAFDWFSSCPNPLHMALLFCNSVPLIPGAHMQLAAAAHGLGSCWIGYLDINRASDILELPPDVRCFFLMPLGYPAEQPTPERLPLTHITFNDAWGASWEPATKHPAFDQLVLRYYEATDEAEWVNTWGQTAVTSAAWIVLHHSKPRYKGDSLELVAQLDGEIVGFMDVEIESQPEELGYAKDSRCGFVWEFGVRPDYQKKGIATAMVEHAREWLTARGIKRMEFWSMDEHACAWYEKMGMREMERHWQFFMGLPAEVTKTMREEDGVGVQVVYGTCAEDKLDQVTERYRVRTEGPESPRICIGYDMRW